MYPPFFFFYNKHKLTSDDTEEHVDISIEDPVLLD